MPLDPFSGEPVRNGAWWEWPGGGKLRVISGGDGDDEGGADLGAALDAAGKAAADRIENEGGDADDDDLDDVDDAAALKAGADAAAKARQKPAEGDEGATKEGEPVPWDEHKKLRDENANYRKRWQPFEKAFGDLGEGATTIIAADPALVADMAYLAREAKTMHPDDKAYIERVTAIAEDDPAEAGRLLAVAAQAYREDPAPDANAKDKKKGSDDDEGDDGEDEDDDLPVTRAELKEWERKQTEQAQRIADERAIEAQTETITKQMKDLGYDPDSEDPIERARASTLIELAQQDPRGDLKKAHEALAKWEQSVIDKAMGKKRKDAARATAPDNGAAPSGERALESMEDAAAAMDARLEGAGITPKRR